MSLSQIYRALHSDLANVRCEAMIRSHKFVRYLQLKSLLEKTLGEMRELESSDVDFRLDREFSVKLDELISRYGYTGQEVVELIELVDEHEVRGSVGFNLLMERIPQGVESGTEMDKEQGIPDRKTSLV